MTQEEKIAMMKTLSGEPSLDTATATAYLAVAEDMILNKRYPFNRPNNAVVEPRYEVTQVRLAVAIKGKYESGVEADMASHEESANGTNVRDTYANLAVQGMSQFAPYLIDIVPFAKVV